MLAGSFAAVLGFNTLNNFRDLGGTACGTSAVIKPGKIFRSATPADISAEDVQMLEERYGSLRVLDLRKRQDALKDGGARLLAGQTQHIELLSKEKCRNRLVRYGMLKKMHVTLPLVPFRLIRSLPIPPLRNFGSKIVDRGTRAFLNSVSLADIYWWILRDHPTELRRSLDICCNEARANPVLVHCAHGKDRTGVVIAILLHICGASQEQIAADYALSNDWGCSPEGQEIMLQAMPERYQQRFRSWGVSAESDWTDHEWPVFGAWCGADESTIFDLFQRVQRRYGSMDAYLDSIGIDASRRADIAAVLSSASADATATAVL